MGRPAQVRIALDALRDNYRWLRERHGGRSFAVLKADGYGHGAVRCAKALSHGPVQADAFAVAFVDEALALRAAGITRPILVLEGAFDADDLAAVHHAGLWTVIHQASQLDLLASLPESARLQVWLKLDSGMHRAGFAAPEFRAAWQQLRQSERIANVTLMTHLARADEPEALATAAQIRAFDQATAGLEAPRSIANSAALLAFPSARRDWGRPGIALYGANPIAGDDAPLRPVMTLSSRVFAVREVMPGDAVGYGGTWTAHRRSRLGLVALGYADGYPRSVSPGTEVLVDGQRCSLAGRVSMDMLMVDLTDHPQAGVGTEVEFWGESLSVNEAARAAGTISYALLCGVKRAGVQVLGEDAGAR
jgi:alanine racemase